MTQFFLSKSTFPIMMIVLSIGAAIVHATGGEYPKAIYWSAAAVLTTSTLFM